MCCLCLFFCITVSCLFCRLRFFALLLFMLVLRFPFLFCCVLSSLFVFLMRLFSFVFNVFLHVSVFINRVICHSLIGYLICLIVFVCVCVSCVLVVFPCLKCCLWFAVFLHKKMSLVYAYSCVVFSCLVIVCLHEFVYRVCLA